MSAAARAEPGTRLSAALVAEQTGVPLPTVQKLMGRLAQSGLLGSARGSGGGFVLARAADSISLADIVEAVDGPIAMTARSEERSLGKECVSKCSSRGSPTHSKTNIRSKEILQHA